MNELHPAPDAWNDRLSEYLDDELDAADRAAVEAHLETCAACRTDLAALRQVVARAGSLHDTRPRADLWSGIQARIQADVPTRVPRRYTFTLPQLVAASLALMVLSGGMVWLARLGGPTTDFAQIGATSSPDVAATPASFSDGPYDAAVDDLRRTLDAGRGSLDPQTLRVLEQNLETIDRAIAQCRDALAEDPANVYLNSYLAAARGRKLQLLRRAVAIVQQTDDPRRPS